MITLISFIIVIGILVFVHEFGHFIVAKKTGVEVEKFSLGFGPKIIGFKKGGTQYMISAIPLGGYVKLKGENPDDPLTNDPKEFGSRSVRVRGAIVFAGPLMNYLLAFILMPLVYIIGIQVPAFLDKEAVVHWVVANSPAMKAGFKLGDRILAVEGEEVTNWEKFIELTQKNLGKDLKIEFSRNHAIQEQTVTLNTEFMGIGEIGLLYKMDARVGGVDEGSPALEVGLKPGDLIKQVGSSKITHWVQMSEVIKNYPGREVIFKIERDEELLAFKIKPVARINKIEENSAADLAGLKEGDVIQSINNEDVSHWSKALLTKSFPKGDKLLFGVSRDGKQNSITVVPKGIQDIGITVGARIGIKQFENTVLQRHGIISSLKKGFEKNIKLTGLIFWAFGKLFTLKLSIKTLGGPITIAKMTGTAAQSGISSLLYFAAFLSINLGILNLLPIPILDGGHLFFLLIELIMRKPLGTKKMEMAQKIGFALLILLFLTVTYNDIMRIIPHKYLEFLPWK